MTVAYLGGLLLSIAGLLALDWRYKLAFWAHAKRTTLTLVCAILFFTVWDLLGIFLGIFLHGQSPYQLPFTIVPHFPVEEIVFLFLLTYCTLVTYNGIVKWRSRT